MQNQYPHVIKSPKPKQSNAWRSNSVPNVYKSVLRISNKRTAFFLLDQLSITLICYDLSYNVYLFPIGL